MGKGHVSAEEIYGEMQSFKWINQPPCRRGQENEER